MNNTLQANIDALIEHIDKAFKKNSVTNVQVAAIFDFLNRYCLREDKEAVFQEIAAFVKGLLIGSDGSGITVLPDGTTQAVVDRLVVRLKATFESLQIKESTYIGGEYILSHAGMRCINVEEDEDVYRCYFTASQDGQAVKNYFTVGSLGFCKQDGLKSGDNVSNRFYWRLVTAIGDDYIDLSKTVCDQDSDIPQAGDAIAALGHQTDISLQGAIVLSSVNETAPSITLYAGINDFSLAGKELIGLGLNQATGKAYLRVYGDAYIGAKDKSSYIEYTTENGVEIKGRFYNSAGQELGDIVDSLGVDVEAMKNQSDRQYILWFGTEIPTLLNYPAEDWEESEYKSHAEDLFYLDNDADEENNGRAWRFQVQADGEIYGWNEVTDKYVLQCLKTAAEAKKEAQSKKRIFVSQPTDDLEYDVGDMWVNAYYKNADGSYLYEDDTLVCKVAKAAGAPFNINHWKPASFGTKANIVNTGEAIRAEVQASINAVNDSLASLEVTVNSIEASVQNIHFDEAGNIENISINGLVANADFSALVSQIIDADGNVVKQAQISTFVTMDDVNEAISNIELSADQINFIGKTIINGAFVVDEQGKLTLNDIVAVNGVYSGVLDGVTGTFKELKFAEKYASEGDFNVTINGGGIELGHYGDYHYYHLSNYALDLNICSTDTYPVRFSVTPNGMSHDLDVNGQMLFRICGIPNTTMAARLTNIGIHNFVYEENGTLKIGNIDRTQSV